MINNNISGSENLADEKTKREFEEKKVFFIIIFFALLPLIVLFILKNFIKNQLTINNLTKIDTPCFQFSIKSKSFKFNDKNKPNNCLVDLSNYNREYIHIEPLLYNENYLKKNLKEFIQADKKDFLSMFSNGKINYEGEIKFTNLSGYGYIGEYELNDGKYKTLTLIVYNPEMNIRLSNSPARYFYILFTFNKNIYEKNVKDIEASWKWILDNFLENNTLTTSCYSFKLKNKIEKQYHSSNDCIFTLVFKTEPPERINITYFINTKGSLEDEVKLWKENNVYTIISERKFEIDKKPAYQIIYKYDNSSNLWTVIFVFSGNKYEHIFGFPNNGFVISSIYSDNSESKVNLDYLLKTWKWL